MIISFEIPDELFKSAMIVIAIDAEVGVTAYSVEWVRKPIDEGWKSGCFGVEISGETPLTTMEKLETLVACRSFAMNCSTPVEFLFNTSSVYHAVFWRYAQPAFV